MGSFRLFRAFGIQVHLHWSWLLVVMIQVQWAGGGVESMAWRGLEIVALFTIVVLHEFGHALACRSVGGRAEHIVLWPLGGIAFVQPPQRPGAVLWSIAAGPLVNVVLLPVTVVAYFAATAVLGQYHAFTHFAFVVAVINLGLLIFNLLPVYPLDGGQILQATLWFFMGRAKSLMVSAGIGLGVAALVALPLLYFGEWWLLLVAAFIAWQAWNGLRYARALTAQERAWGEQQAPWKM